MSTYTVCAMADIILDVITAINTTTNYLVVGLLIYLAYLISELLFGY